MYRDIYWNIILFIDDPTIRLVNKEFRDIFDSQGQSKPIINTESESVALQLLTINRKVIPIYLRWGCGVNTLYM